MQTRRVTRPERFTIPSPGYRPVDGRKPTTPQNEAGTVMEAPVSVPMLNGTIPSATAAALPPLDPPAVLVGSSGLRTGPKCALLLVIPKASSCMFVLPSSTAPASRSTLTIPASIGGAP